MGKTWQYAWASPNSAIGLALAALALRRRRLRLVDGVLEAHGPLLRWLLQRLPLAPHGVAAMTLGHVVVGQDPRTLAATRRHERIHVAQYERWGALFLPAYLGSSLWALLRGGHPYFDNVFEREAMRGDAGPEGPALRNPSRGTRPPHRGDTPPGPALRNPARGAPPLRRDDAPEGPAPRSPGSVPLEGKPMKLRTTRAPRFGMVLLATALAASSLHADTLVYRNGREVQGRLVGLYGDIIEFEDARDGRTRRIDRRDVERIEFDDYVTDRPGNDWAPSPSGGPSPGMREREVLAYANTPWSDTGIDLRRGQTVYFRARGEVRWGPDRKDGPAGEKNSPRNPNRPIPGRPGAALIGKIGDGSTDVFFIGDTTGPVRVQSSGRLYLGVNDDYLQDNRGFFTVVVSY